MPVFHSYVNDDGYYITARPSDVGNVTYQTTKAADQLLVELGYGDEDQLPWGVINPLRSANLIYTNSQGVDDTTEDIPSLDPSKLAEMTEREIRKLLDYFDSRGDIPDEVYDQLEKKIESRSETMLERVSEKFHTKFPDNATSVKITWLSESHNEISRIRVEVKDLDIIHDIEMGSGPIIDEWKVRHRYEHSWEGMAKAYETRPKIMRAIGEVDSDLPFEIEWLSGRNGGYLI